MTTDAAAPTSSERREGASSRTSADACTEPRWHVLDDRVACAGANPLGNPFYGYRTTRLLLPDGRRATYHGVVVGATVHALPVEEDLTTHLVTQPRPNARAAPDTAVPCVLELPGGFADPRLGLAASADLELCQEIGRRAHRMESLGVLMPSVGLTDERDHVFLATRLYPAVDDEHDEATEQDLRVVSGPFGRLYDQVTSGRAAVSAATVGAFALAARRL